MNNTSTAEREISTTRLLNASREKVWDAWTDPKQVAQWWGPNGFTNTIHQMEVKVGGVWKLTMHGPDGRDYPNQMLFTEIVKPERLVYLHGSDENFHKDGFEVTVTFEEKESQTELHMQMVFKTKEERDAVVEKFGALEGQKQTIARLEAFLAAYSSSAEGGEQNLA